MSRSLTCGLGCTLALSLTHSTIQLQYVALYHCFRIKQTENVSHRPRFFTRCAKQLKYSVQLIEVRLARKQRRLFEQKNTLRCSCEHNFESVQPMLYYVLPWHSYTDSFFPGQLETTVTSSLETIQQEWLKSKNLSLNEAIDIAQNRPLCRD